MVVTGLGCVSPLGLSAEDSFNKAVEGVSGVQRITRFDPENFAAQIAGEVKNFSAEGVLDTKDQKKMDLFIQYAMVAAGSVVTKDIQPYALVVGNPARQVAIIDKAGNIVSTVK